MPEVIRLDHVQPTGKPPEDRSARLLWVLGGLVAVLIVGLCYVGGRLIVASRVSPARSAQQAATPTNTAPPPAAPVVAAPNGQAANPAVMQPIQQSPSMGMPGTGASTRPQTYQSPQPMVATAAPRTPQDVIAQVKQSVVLIIAQIPDGVASGTGFVVGQGQIATCAHVIEGATQIMAVTSDGRQIQCSIGGADPTADVAVLRCNAPLPPALALANPPTVRDGDPIAVTGYPVTGKFTALGFVPTASTSQGTINAKRVRYQNGVAVDQLQTDAAINPGNSGGPAYSLRDGSVYGLAASGLVQERGISFAVSVSHLRRFLY